MCATFGRLAALAPLLLALGCGDGDDSKRGSGGGGASGGSSGSGGSGGGGGSSGSGGSGAAGSGGSAGTPPTLDCPNKLAPHEPKGQVEKVGSGTAASCTEQALHDAVAKVDGGTVTFDCGGEHTITLTKSLFVPKSMLLDGGGQITLSGGGKVRVIELEHHIDFVIQRITIRDGFVAAGSENESGAGLLHPWFGTLEAIDVRFENNHSASQDHDVGGGAIYAGGLTRAVLSGCVFENNSGSTGGGVLSRSTNLSVANCVFFGNAATTYAASGQYGNGGGLYIDRMWLDAPKDFAMCGTVFEKNSAKVHGSALFSYNLEGSGASIERCTFDQNVMEGTGTGSVYHEGVPLSLTTSTFSGNSTGQHAGGLFLGGGSDAKVENCTFDGNTTPGNAGALWAGNGNVEVANVTFANNSADYGPVIFKGQSGKVKLTNVIFANNKTANQYSALACHETFDDGGGVIQWPDKKNSGSKDTPCAAGAVFADPGLGALADNGGPTKTMALSAGSPAIDVGATCSELDQRGEPRVGKCDSGAFEFQP